MTPCADEAGSVAVAVLRERRLRALAVLRERRVRAPAGRLTLSRRGEAGLALVLSLLCAATALGPHVAAGGRYLDDWWLGAYIRFPREMGFAGAGDYLRFYSGARPGAVLYWLVTYDLFGFHDGWHRAASVALSGLLAAVFYLLLRELRLARLDAAAIALLTLALPVADSIHFWVTPAVGQLCVAACAGGLLLALRAFEAQGRRALLLHAASLALLAGSLTIAETMLPAIALSLLVYRTRVGWRRALDRCAVDLVLVGIGILHYALAAPTRLAAVAPDAGAITRALALADGALTLLTSTLAPFAPSRWWVLVPLVVLAAVASWRLRRAEPEAPDGAERPQHAPRRARARARAARRDEWAARERRWLVAAAIAALLAGASYVIYVPADPSYSPLAAGVGNRVNLGALLPLSVLLYALLRLAGGLFAAPRLRLVVTIALFVALLGVSAARLQADRRLWGEAAQEQELALSALHRALPDPPRGASLLVFGTPGVVTRFGRIGHRPVNQPVPVFSTWWELDVAVKLSYERPDLAAYPIWGGQAPQLICGASDVYQLGLDGVRHALAYGTVFAVDTIEERAVRLDDQAQCDRVTRDGSTIRYDLPV